MRPGACVAPPCRQRDALRVQALQLDDEDSSTSRRAPGGEPAGPSVRRVISDRPGARVQPPPPPPHRRRASEGQVGARGVTLRARWVTR
jgi:hypothetical protein